MGQTPNYNKMWTTAGEKMIAEDKITAPWQDYPRPQLKREGYLILNGEWKLNNSSTCVPYPPQSILSGYAGEVGGFLVYERKFVVPVSFTGKRVLLHFGAVDQICEVWLNGVLVGSHEGGYLPFALDITDSVKREEENCLEVKVTDTLSEKYPYGKQRKKRGGMWYTPVSGIWKTVWLENVPESYIGKIAMTPDLEGVEIKIYPEGSDTKTDSFEVIITLENGEQIHKSLSGNGWGAQEKILLTEHVCADGTPYEPILWTPENPHLYPMKVTFGEDCVETYFALRTIDIRKISGVNRVCLNGNPIFMHGVLDQGYYSDGIYLPAEEAEFERDILRMKQLGFNMLRKHIKIEPECFYYYCDLHGMLVVQDMVNNGHYSYIPQTVLPTIGFKKKKDTGGNPDEERKIIFRKHTADTIDHLYNHPCIIAYTIFNEGWGQFDSDSLYDAVKQQDPTRLVDSTSGWFAQERNDFDSEHIYFRSIELTVRTRPLFLSECGGFSLLIQGHLFNADREYGYGKCNNIAELTQKIVEMYREMVLPAIPKGLCGCVYTQLSDVEDEINGLYTYDRKVCKVEEEKFVELADEISRTVHSVE